MSYGYDNYGQSKPQQPSRATTFRMDSNDPYSAGNSRARLNEDDDVGVRYRDHVGAGHRGYPSIDTMGVHEKPVGGGVRNSDGSHFSPVSPRFARGKETFKTWRHTHYEAGIWTRGSGLACVGRFLCCTIMITLLLLISIVLSIAVYIRPPDVQIGTVALDTDATTGAIERNSTTITIHLKVPLTVNNPNFFDAGFTKVVATAVYPLGGVDFPIGGGTMSNVNFKSGTNTTINFPLSFQYSNNVDPNLTLIGDIANRCGVNGGTKRDLPIDYSIKVDLKIIVPTISPTFAGHADFPCPLSEGDFGLLAGGLLGGS